MKAALLLLFLVHINAAPVQPRDDYIFSKMEHPPRAETMVIFLVIVLAVFYSILKIVPPRSPEYDLARRTEDGEVTDERLYAETS